MSKSELTKTSNALPAPAGADDEISLDESEDMRIALGTDQEPQPTDDPEDFFNAFDPDADEDVEADRVK